MKTILIADDEPNIAAFLKEILQDAQYQVLSVSNGQEALAYMKDHKVDYVITDILMPHMNGIELTKSIQSQYPETKVIVISGGGETGGVTKHILMDAAVNFGAISCVEKPFRAEQILAAIKDDCDKEIIPA